MHVYVPMPIFTYVHVNICVYIYILSMYFTIYVHVFLYLFISMCKYVLSYMQIKKGTYTCMCIYLTVLSLLRRGFLCKE